MYFDTITKTDLDLLEVYLRGSISAGSPLYRDVIDAMNYSLLSGGKRVRALFCMEVCRALGGKVEAALPFAAAVEMVHAYSLIHDDLPCMDDDDLRRGKPSNHKVFGEANALLAGDGLLTHAFYTLATADTGAQQGLLAVKLLAEAAGCHGMIGGQVIDLGWENRDTPAEVLEQMHRLKTGALIAVAAQLGAVAAGHTGDEELEILGDFARMVGLAFQIVDDILDATGDEQKLGKPIGSDAQQGKTTFITLYGLERSQEAVRQLTSDAIKKLYQVVAPESGKYLASLCWRLTDREN